MKEPLRHNGECVNCGHIGEHTATCWWARRFAPRDPAMSGEQADAFEAQLAAPDLPPHVVQALVDGLPDGVRVGLVADGRDIPEGWERAVGKGWLTSKPSNAFPYVVRPPVPPATVTVELPVGAAHRIAMQENVGSPQPTRADAAAVVEACKASLDNGPCRAALPEDDQ